jgi:hypothetical protein
MVQHINNSGGWTIVGWFMMGSVVDAASNITEKIQNREITIHISHLHPSVSDALFQTDACKENLIKLEQSMMTLQLSINFVCMLTHNFCRAVCSVPFHFFLTHTPLSACPMDLAVFSTSFFSASSTSRYSSFLFSLPLSFISTTLFPTNLSSFIFFVLPSSHFTMKPQPLSPLTTLPIDLLACQLVQPLCDSMKTRPSNHSKPFETDDCSPSNKISVPGMILVHARVNPFSFKRTTLMVRPSSSAFFFTTQFHPKWSACFAGIPNSGNCISSGIFGVTVDPFSNLVTANTPHASLMPDFRTSTHPLHAPPFATNMRNTAFVPSCPMLLTPTRGSCGPTSITSSNFCYLTDFTDDISDPPSTTGLNHSTSHSHTKLFMFALLLSAPGILASPTKSQTDSCNDSS